MVTPPHNGLSGEVIIKTTSSKRTNIQFYYHDEKGKVNRR